MRDASPEARALAGLGADLIYLGLAALALFAGIDRYAPPQDLPWKPLRLSDPLGLATTAKLERIIAEPGRCLAFLREQGVAFTLAPDRDAGGFCAIRNAVRLGPGAVRLSPAAPLMSCPLAAAFVLWSRQAVAPAARELLGRPVAAIDHYGTYACRHIYGQAKGAPSQHAYAQAVDVAGFTLSGGRRVSVARDWRGDGPQARFLHRVRAQGCRLFRVSLSPDYNAAHHDHLHLDMNPYRLCR